jgi:hypothetical protein
MTHEHLEHWAPRVAAIAAALFIADLFLGWQRTSVRVGGMVGVDHMASGWSGWGALAGLCAVVLVVLAIGGRAQASATAAAGAALFVLAALAVATADAHVSMHGRDVGLMVDSTRWPSWVGLGLAAVAALAGAAPFLAERRYPEPGGSAA